MSKIVVEVKKDFDVRTIIGYDEISLVCNDYSILWKHLLDIRNAMPLSNINLTKRGIGNIITTVLVLEKLNGMTLVIDNEEDASKLYELDNFLTLYDPDKWELIVKPEIKINLRRLKRWDISDKEIPQIE